jgi:glucose/arabinose dehydrogenase
LARHAVCLLAAFFVMPGIWSGCARAEAETTPATVTPIEAFEEPWAMAFLPDGRLLITEKKGALKLYAIGAQAHEVRGVPRVAYAGQGGLGDVALDPDFARNRLVYLSYAEAGEAGARGAAVARGELVFGQGGGGTLLNLSVIWRQVPKVTGGGHYGHRILFGSDGRLWISSGERQKFDPAQQMSSNLGKILRLNPDGSAPADNPFADRDGVARQVWTLGHRNPLGIAFDPQGRLWNCEMGPKGGDELNLVVRGSNYGYPIVSNGDHYDGRPIPDHDTKPEFAAPAISWTPVISPAALIFYTGSEFPAWRGNALIASLSANALVRVAVDGQDAREVERLALGHRIREVEQGPDGAIWVLEDGSGGRLLKLTASR